jgi:hypothetical protein
MQITTRLVSAAVFAVLGSAAMAQEATQPSTWMTPSTLARADVQADAQAALRDGTLPRHEASYTVVAGRSTMTRAQVMAEAREAMRLGLIPVHEGGARVPTAAESEQIRQAGQRTLDAGGRFAGL